MIKVENNIPRIYELRGQSTQGGRIKNKEYISKGHKVWTYQLSGIINTIIDKALSKSWTKLNHKCTDVKDVKRFAKEITGKEMENNEKLTTIDKGNV